MSSPASERRDHQEPTGPGRFTDADRRRLSVLARHAFARELFHDLELVSSAYRDWQDGHIDVLELDDFIHDYVEDSFEQAYRRYSTLDAETIVARALSLGLVEDSEIPSALREKLAPSIRALHAPPESGGDPAGRDRTEEEELAALREQRHRWIAAINEGSVDGFLAVVTDDAVWLPPRHDAIRGKKDIRAWLGQPFARLDYEYSVSDVRVRLAGGWTIEQARFSARARKKSGDALPPHEGIYTLLWRKTTSGWLIERYVDHSAGFVAEGGTGS